MSNLNLGLLKNKVGAPADLDAGGVEIASSAGPGWAWHNAHILSGAILLLCLFELILDSNSKEHCSFTACFCCGTKTTCEPLNEADYLSETTLPAPSKINSLCFPLNAWPLRVQQACCWTSKFWHWYFLPGDHNASIIHWDENIHKNVTSVNHQRVIVEMLFCLSWSSIAVHGNSLSSRFIWNVRCE